MADKKISELVNLTSLATDDEFVVVDADANATKRITATNLSKFPAGVTVPDAGTIGSASDPDAMSIASGGVVTFSQGIALASGKGIDFSATANGAATTTSELFDDYEEGTWTPVIVGTSSAGTGSYARQFGQYTKIGNTVHYHFLVNYSSHTGTGNLRITGLPFTAFNDGVSAYYFTAAYISNIVFPANTVHVLAQVNSNSTVMDFVCIRDNNTPIALSMDASGLIIATGFYVTP